MQLQAYSKEIVSLVVPFNCLDSQYLLQGESSSAARESPYIHVYSPTTTVECTGKSDLPNPDGAHAVNHDLECRARDGYEGSMGIQLEAPM